MLMGLIQIHSNRLGNFTHLATLQNHTELLIS